MFSYYLLINVIFLESVCKRWGNELFRSISLSFSCSHFGWESKMEQIKYHILGKNVLLPLALCAYVCIGVCMCVCVLAQLLYVCLFAFVAWILKACGNMTAGEASPRHHELIGNCGNATGDLN